MTPPASMREADRRGGCVRTASGRYCSVTDPSPEDLVLGDIAHALAQINRYTGHAPYPFSVAQHSLIVSRLVPPPDALDGLFHDATEAYLADVNRPLKHSGFMAGYRENEQKFHGALARKFGLATPVPNIVKVADMHAYAMECYVLFGEPLPAKLALGYRAHQEMFEPWDWVLAKEEFLNRFHTLTARRLG